jgi:hypothetical protein
MKDNHAPMDLVKLYTRGGDYVATIRMPPFNPPPEAISWATRLFARNEEGDYREGMTWFAPDDATVNPDDVTDEKDLA